jgi:hypothetical protein
MWAPFSGAGKVTVSGTTAALAQDAAAFGIGDNRELVITGDGSVTYSLANGGVTIGGTTDGSGVVTVTAASCLNLTKNLTVASGATLALGENKVKFYAPVTLTVNGKLTTTLTTSMWDAFEFPAAGSVVINGSYEQGAAPYGIGAGCEFVLGEGGQITYNGTTATVSKGAVSLGAQLNLKKALTVASGATLDLGDKAVVFYAGSIDLTVDAGGTLKTSGAASMWDVFTKAGDVSTVKVVVKGSYLQGGATWGIGTGREFALGAGGSITYDVASPGVTIAGAVTANGANGRIELTKTHIVDSGAVLTLNGDLTLPVGTLTVTGTLAGTGTLTNAGTINGSGDVNVAVNVAATDALTTLLASTEPKYHKAKLTTAFYTAANSTGTTITLPISGSTAAVTITGLGKTASPALAASVNIQRAAVTLEQVNFGITNDTQAYNYTSGNGQNDGYGKSIIYTGTQNTGANVVIKDCTIAWLSGGTTAQYKSVYGIIAKYRTGAGATQVLNNTIDLSGVAYDNAHNSWIHGVYIDTNGVAGSNNHPVVKNNVIKGVLVGAYLDFEYVPQGANIAANSAFFSTTYLDGNTVEYTTAPSEPNARYKRMHGLYEFYFVKTNPSYDNVYANDYVTNKFGSNNAETGDNKVAPLFAALATAANGGIVSVNIEDSDNDLREHYFKDGDSITTEWLDTATWKAKGE